MTAFIMICLIVEEIVKDRYMYGDSLGPLTNNKHAFTIYLRLQSSTHSPLEIGQTGRRRSILKDTLAHDNESDRASTHSHGKLCYKIILVREL